MDRLNQIDQNIDPLDILTGSIEVNVRFLGIRGQLVQLCKSLPNSSEDCRLQVSVVFLVLIVRRTATGPAAWKIPFPPAIGCCIPIEFQLDTVAYIQRGHLAKTGKQI